MKWQIFAGIYGERTAPWVERMGFENVKTVLLDADKRKELWEGLNKAIAAKGRNDTWGPITKDVDLREKMYTIEKPELVGVGE